MVMRKMLFAILMVLCLASCKQSPVSGYVVGKKHVPAHTTTHYDVTLKMPRVTRHPEQWVVWVADSCGVHRCNVDEATFARMNRGQFVTSKGTYNGKESR